MLKPLLHTCSTSPNTVTRSQLTTRETALKSLFGQLQNQITLKARERDYFYKEGGLWILRGKRVAPAVMHLWSPAVIHRRCKVWIWLCTRHWPACIPGATDTPRNNSSMMGVGGEQEIETQCSQSLGKEGIRVSCLGKM